MKTPDRYQVAVLVAASFCSHWALAGGLASGQTLEYEVKQMSTTKTDLSNLPANIRARAEQNQAAGNGKTATTIVSMTVDSVDADGNAHVSGKFSQSMEGVSGVAASVFAGAHEFKGQVMADGRVIPTFDSDAPSAVDSHGRLTAANAPNLNGHTVQGMFVNFNTLITGASKRTKFKAGDVWHLSVQDAIGITRLYDFAVMELDPSDASAAVVSMKGDFSGDTSSQKINTSGHYDLARRSLNKYHEENIYSSSMPNGMSTSGTTIVEIVVRK